MICGIKLTKDEYLYLISRCGKLRCGRLHPTSLNVSFESVLNLSRTNLGILCTFLPFQAVSRGDQALQLGLHSLSLQEGLPTDRDCFKLLRNVHQSLPLGLRQKEEGVKAAQQGHDGKQREAVRAESVLRRKSGQTELCRLDLSWSVRQAGWLLRGWDVTCTHDEEREYQAHHGEHEPTLQSHEDERRQTIGLNKELGAECDCGGACKSKK